jgi:hypothetical protein
MARKASDARIILPLLKAVSFTSPMPTLSSGGLKNALQSRVDRAYERSDCSMRIYREETESLVVGDWSSSSVE